MTSAERVTQVARRVWAAPLAAHALALGLVLLAALQVVGHDSSYSADEGAALVQARSLADGDGWIVEHPLPEADPTGRRYPLELSEWGEKGVAPYAKHPLYPVVLAGADRVGGVPGIYLLSVVGTVVASAGAALLSTRVAPGLERSTLWVLGLLSPLFFDSFWVIAHSLAAGLVALAAVAAARAVERERWGWVAVAGGLLALAIGFRTEAAFVGIAAGMVAAYVAWRGRSRIWLALAGASLAAVLGVRAVERLLIERIIGGAVTDPGARASDADSGSFLGDRWAGFRQTWIRADDSGRPSATLLVLFAVLMGALAAWYLHRRGTEGRLIRLYAVVAAVLVLVRVTVVPVEAVPGLLAAFPLLWIGWIAGGGEVLRSPASRVLAAIALVGAAGVLATQYPEGGTAEWGGRYFAVFLPLAVPLSVAGLAAPRAATDRRTFQLAGACLVVASLGLSTMAVREVRRVHGFTTDALALIDEAASTLERPVIVSTVPAMPRLAWRTFDRQQWLLIDRASDDELVADLHRAGISRVVLYSRDLEAVVGQLDATRVPGTPAGNTVAVIDL